MKGSIRRKRKPAAVRLNVDDVRGKVISVRCAKAEYELIARSANEAGLAIGGYLRNLALGSPGPRAIRRPFVDRVALARHLGELGKLGSNVNQIAKLANQSRQPPRGQELALMQADIAIMRAALLHALEREA